MELQGEVEKKEMVEKVIEVENLRKYYGNIKAVDGISFHVRKGQVFTLLGPNGAGKTTSVEILEGLKEPDGGQLTILGQPCKKVGPEHKDRIGVVLQDTRFIDRIKTREMLEIFASFFSKSSNPDDILKRISLEDKAGAMVEDLSGGQRQRLAIGLALINDPDIIFMDEPTTGLDPQARRNIWDLIIQLKKEEKTIFLTTHYMEEAEKLSDYVYIMDHGKIIASGTVPELINSIHRENIIEFDRADLDGNKVGSLKEAFPGLNEVDSTLSMFTENVSQSLASLMQWANENSIGFENLSIRRPNLEDVFLSLTGKGLRD